MAGRRREPRLRVLAAELREGLLRCGVGVAVAVLAVVWGWGAPSWGEVAWALGLGAWMVLVGSWFPPGGPLPREGAVPPPPPGGLRPPRALRPRPLALAAVAAGTAGGVGLLWLVGVEDFPGSMVGVVVGTSVSMAWRLRRARRWEEAHGLRLLWARVERRPRVWAEPGG